MARRKGGKKKQAWKQREFKHHDVIIHHNEARESDIVIPVMGPTGVGKSTFINALLGRPVMQVGHDLNRPSLNGRRIVIVDTPGFDDTYTEDSEILRRIAVWLASSYDADMKLGGVIYLHDISKTRMLGTTRKNFDMFRKLCGDGAVASVILGTTKWAEVQQDVGERREKQLIETYWKDMTNQGSRVRRFGATHKSAWDIVYCILDALAKNEALQIQHELVNLQQYIPETDAGQTLRYTLQQLLEVQKKMAEALAAQAACGDDPQVQTKLEEHRNQMRTTLKQINDLKISISRPVMSLFGLRYSPEPDAGKTLSYTLQQHDCKITKDTGVVILLLGQTGVGKSTFINKVARKDVAEVGHDLRPRTSDVKPFVIAHPEDPTRRVLFIDTPGFNSDGIWLEDKKILQQILDWLQTSCNQDVRFGGILYLHDITMCREAAGASVTISTDLLLSKMARNVLFVTVKWKKPESAEQQHREQLMITNWKDMIDGGLRVTRLESTISSWNIVDKLLESPVELDVVQQTLNIVLGELSEKPAKGIREFFSSLFHQSNG